MAERTVDVAIIGAGTAGLGAYREVRDCTDSVVLIDDGPLGTTCARVGCMPSKLLIAAAEAVHSAQNAPAFGVHPGPVEIDGAAVMKRVRSERDRFVSFVLKNIDGFPDHHKIAARAQFLDDRMLTLSNGDTVRAERIVIAVGSRPNVPPFFQKLGDRLIVNDDVFEWQDLPESIAVFGAGIIGLEIGQALHRLGVRVRVFGRGGGIGPLSDPEVAKAARAAFEAELAIDPDADVTSLEGTDEGAAITFKDPDGKDVTETFDYVLAATGRVSNADRLGLEATSLELDAKGIPVFDTCTMQCGDSSIFIAGDSNNEIPLLHEASDQGHIAGANAARFPAIRRGLRRSPLAVMFSDPQIAMVGRRFADLGTPPCDFVVGEVSFEDQGRSRVMNVNQGLLRVYADYHTEMFLGAEMAGPRAEHLAHLLAWAHQQHMTIAEMLNMPFYHPVVEEGLRTALRDAAKALKAGPPPADSCLDCGPGA